MADKYFTVTLSINAPSKEAVEKMLDGMPHADRIFDDDIVDDDAVRFEGRIRYVENWNGKGEHFVFENHWTDEEWGLECAFPLVRIEDGDMVIGEGELIHYTALTKIREWKKLNVPFYFAKE